MYVRYLGYYTTIDPLVCDFVTIVAVSDADAIRVARDFVAKQRENYVVRNPSVRLSKSAFRLEKVINVDKNEVIFEKKH